MDNKAPKSLRLHIGLFGRTNVGKSSFLNYVCGQDAAITSAVPGTTTDVVEKTMELLPVGPVVFLDTAGIDDTSVLSQARLQKTFAAFERCDVVLLLVEAATWSAFEDGIISESRLRKIPCIVVITKADIYRPEEAFISKANEDTAGVLICSSVDMASRDKSVNRLKQMLIAAAPDEFFNPYPLISDLVPAGGLAVLMVPIDLEAPKGRLILPQVQTLREVLDSDAASVVVKEHEYQQVLGYLNRSPDLVVCDSQVVDKMVAETPADVACTTFSMLFARYKGDLAAAARAVAVIDDLREGDKILIAESCSHHPIEGDIGREKIPRWLRQYTGIDIRIDTCAGKDYPQDLSQYRLIIHCGGCMLNRNAMLARLQRAHQADIPITNYGVCISFLQGVLERVLSPFPEALDVYQQAKPVDKTTGSQVCA